MNKFARFLALCGVLIAAPATAQASYSSLYVFGDSLVDSGNAFIQTGGIEAPSDDGFFLGRFSNGPNFADYLSFSLDGTLATPALAGGDNYAVGGATAAYTGSLSPSFVEQIVYFDVLGGGAPIPSDALVLVAFGGNDVRETIGVGGAIDFTSSVGAFGAGLDMLYARGARNFLVAGPPDIGLLPRSLEDAGDVPGRLAELTSRSLQISTLFQGTSAAFADVSGAQVNYFDLFSFDHAVRADPAAFGLPATLDTADPCQIIGGGLFQFSNCANSLFFDEIHPTTIAHLAIASAMSAQLDQASAVPEPATWLMLLLGFGLLGTKVRTTRRRALLAA